MADCKVVMLTDASMTLEKVQAEDAQNEFARLAPFGAEIAYVEGQKGLSRHEFSLYASKVEKEGPEAFPTIPELLAEIEDADVLIVNFAPVNAETIKAAKKLKLIAVTRSGAENVNLEAATEAGVKVTVSPGRLVEPVSDYTVGMMIAESRNIARMSITANGGKWLDTAPNVGYIKSLKGQTVGIIGFGIIGRRVAEKLHAFGCNIVAYDPFLPDEVFEQEGARKVELDELMEVSDFVSVHARLTKDTEGLVSAEMIAKMKPHAFFVNTARAGLVDMDALVEALAAHKIGGAALDVFTEEPIPEGHPILALDNVTLTPHRAGNCSNLAALSLAIALTEVENILKGEPLAHPKN
ncbi:2-hydroxyacid dehydrogenase [uncultured Enorma sp.]|jgi:D-3-phosphoglycerate dehydrogenase|uniref:2-hydroxyacid dehydrogenase n=1 Tax=uncultured Enorma sp. TaxID=1714346 RepID=UPI0025D5012A|nr:2-hydroxyacid dehydrogenase [uncultured Enorma sp.]